MPFHSQTDARPTRYLHLGSQAKWLALGPHLLLASAMLLGAESVLAKESQLETVFVGAPVEDVAGPVSETHHGLDAAALDRLQPRNVAELARRLPSAHLPSNSRGETLLYLRGAGERQVAVFFDGALLNIPWDNRADLGLIPGSIIARAVTASGTLSPQYGVNAVGALALFAHDAEPGQTQTELSVGLGSERARQLQFATARAGEAFGWSTHLRHGMSDGHALAGGLQRPFHQVSASLRSNTDERINTGVFRGKWLREGGSLATTLLLNDAERGIAAELDRDASARFWRYPMARLGMAIVSAQSELSEQQELNASVWLQAAEQRIDAYRDDRYQTVSSQEFSSDDTVGLRAIHRLRGEAWLFSSSLNVLSSEHRQRDQVVAGPSAPWLDYSQVTASVGIDAERYLTATCSAELGVGLDNANYPGTADKPEFARQSEPTWRAGLACATTSATRWRASIGEKSRFPTLRELFGSALNRFLINPDLVAEAIRTGELGFEYSGDDLSGSATLFGQWVDDAISERRVGQLRQRVNIAGSKIIGLELASRWTLDPHWNIGLNATFIDGHREGFAGVAKNLIERPDWLVNAHAEYVSDDQLGLSLELVHAGRAYSPDAAGVLVALPSSSQFNLSLSQPFGTRWEWRVSAHNLTDARVLPQQGLPAPGRSLSSQVSWRW